MELVIGGALTHHVGDSVDFGPLPEATARHYFRQLAAAVACAHEHNVAHRDLKVRVVPAPHHQPCAQSVRNHAATTPSNV